MEKDKEIKRRIVKCPKCKKNLAGKKEICPYDEDIEGVKKFCKCCKECRDNCRDDI